ncbi:MAG: dipeptidase PepV [Armatimonadota bacterium]|nr:dipeptidase PepV [bacterium]MCS7310051.1 dipeptidase PepV [Armatimonadota bacterium]MDW8104511.1 dipeptidase PepV [Armatimonadota bacterium]MDW8289907.1 dipeptidase PepV [Armatimonadota bacterium]
MVRDALIRWIESHTEEMIADLRALLQCESVKSEPLPMAPFGRGVRQAFDRVLEFGERYGFRTKDYDGYALHLEIGEGEEIVGTLSHVDVVPPGNGWSVPPFEGVLRDGYLYARGAQDDKGPTVAVLYAARALRELGLPLRKRIRLIVGGDEESGWECMKHYFQHEPERPSCGFTPDGDWPLVYAEKGIVNLQLEKMVSRPDALPRVEWARGGERANMVPDRAEAFLRATEEQAGAIQDALAGMEEIVTTAEEDGVLVVARGRSAHGSSPQEGVNAVARLLNALERLQLPEESLWLDTVRRWANHLDGSALGIAHRDEVSGATTTNLGVFSYDGSKASCTVNVRYPVTWSLDALLAQLQPAIAPTGFSLANHFGIAPLYVPLETPFLQTILRVYREETGDDKPPRTMGGGTYARATPNIVAIGTGFEGDGAAHEPDERIAVSTLQKMTLIYARILYELAQ